MSVYTEVRYRYMSTQVGMSVLVPGNSVTAV
jgi:hypothetical protein